VWRDGEAAGLLIRDKSGGRAVAWCRKQNTAPVPEPQPAVDFASKYVTDERLNQTLAELRADGHSVTVDTVRDRLVGDVARETYVALFTDGEFVGSLSAFKSAVAERVQQHQFTSE